MLIIAVDAGASKLISKTTLLLQHLQLYIRMTCDLAPFLLIVILCCIDRPTWRDHLLLHCSGHARNLFKVCKPRWGLSIGPKTTLQLWVDSASFVRHSK